MGPTVKKSRLFYGYKVLAALFVVGAIGPQARYSLTAFFPAILAETGWSRSEIGLAQSVGLWCYAIFSILTGWMVDRLGAQKTIALGGILCIFGWFLLSTIHSIWQLYFYYGFVMALVTSLLHLVSIQATSRKWFIHRAGLAAGILVSAFAIGSAIFTPILTSATSLFHWRSVSLVCGFAFGLPIILLAYFIIRDTPESMGLYPDGIDPQSGITMPDSSPKKVIIEEQWTIKNALKTPHFWLLFIAYSFSGIVINGLLAHLVVWVTDFSSSTALAGLFMTLYNAPSIVSRVGGGWLGDRFGKYRILTIGTFSSVLIMLITWWWGRGSNQLFFVILLMGLGLNVATGLYAPHVGDLFGRKNVGALFAILTAGWGLIGGLGPLLWGLIYDKTHSYSQALLLSVFSYVVATAALMAIRFIRQPLLSNPNR
jgi:OFA family oxalate/formate antiporter-like MFS transporter